MVVDALHESVREAFGDWQGPPFVLLGSVGPFGLRRGEAWGSLHEAVRSVLAAAEDKVLNEVAQFWVNLGVDLQHARIDDGHVEARFDRVVEENGVDGLANLIISREGERDVG